MAFEKTEYSPGETIKIPINATEDLENYSQPITVKISDVTDGPDYAKVLFEEQKTLQDGKTLFEYTLPKNPDRYRYLVLIDTPSQDISKFIFTKKDASKIVISDIKVLNTTLKQGEPVQFEAKVVDGVGRPAHYLRIMATSYIPHQLCDTQTAGDAGASLDVSPLYSLQPDYWSAGIVKGNMPIQNTARPGTYDVSLHAGGEFEGYQNEQKSFQITIEQSPMPKKTPYSVLTPFKVKFKPELFMTEQPIDFAGHTAYNGCGNIIPNVPIKAEIKRYDLKHGQWMETLDTKETVSNENGEYSFHFEPIGLRAGYYTIHVTPSYNGLEQTVGTEAPYNIKNFTITEQGKEFTVTVDGAYFIPQNVTFDKQKKTLSIELDTSEPYRRVDFGIPNELLDGDFTVLVNGVERDGNIRKTEGYTHFSPWPGEDDHTKIEVIGTSAIPEFEGIALLLLGAAIIPIVILARKSGPLGTRA
ncbi:MAG: hypothetical protein DWQ18_01735 [Crenarchaeota archaeon]|nr:MAG: hypothetical protein DWQ17_06795 [Thermoproteota archaeon]RDJ33676.1 MAG: hypothetical protein DWQ18_01735 [Thermoproteota archaeon]RDJ37254.1 MAG: hypothetical protein DWQ19_01945 [Thermoproteota archaeon]RDJ39208.1 MAG: hypothetical protein DWQ13_02835 [Thermoproteota archaeon]